MRYFLELSYNGSAYHGWQNQPNGITVQETLEKALSTILDENINTMGAGRTDAGVHAKQMFAHFDTEKILETSDLVYKLNSFLPADVAVHQIFKVSSEAHTRFNALSRTYLYRIALQKNVFTSNNTFYVRQKLNLDAMIKASQILFEYKDFQCFSKSKTDVKTYFCTITKVEWKVENNELHFVIQADRFLRNMVRAIVGTMIEIGLGKINIEDLHTIIKSKNRSEAGFSVPAHGLYLTHVEYPEHIKL
ncbi:tRNA pseudouridine(38-40) synthase TruA [uncultured Algibacter sp.]|uniref:tRNA pseudouridine(38-40) synthase TruA n=1 Tax=uncultured Algibacter sp. TaxID=298659 RepID=UPI003217EA58